MEPDMSTPDKILRLKKNDILRNLPANALDISKRLCEYIVELWPRATNRSTTDGNSIFNGPAGIDRTGQ